MKAPFTYVLIAAALIHLNAGEYAFAQEEIKTTLQDQKEVAVTIYNENLALVKDIRKVNFKKGQQLLAFRDVSARMRPETALLRSISSPSSIHLYEQNFDFDLLTPQKMLEKYVGKTVTVIKTHPTTGAETSETASVLSTNSGTVLKMGNRIETGIPGRIVFDSVPDNLRDRPTLVMNLHNQGDTQQNLELSYLTGGLSWKADYVVELAANDDQLDMNGWVTLTNVSGTSYRNAKLQLVAGDVNQVRERMGAPLMAMKSLERAAPIASAPMAQEELFEYHLYTLGRPTTIAENQTKQVALMNGSGIPARKELVLRGADYYYYGNYGDFGKKLKVASYIEFDNKESSQLGMPLPKGVIRVYKKDSSGNAQFIGEDRIDHTPKNEKVRLKLGESFDITADKKQTDYKSLGQDSKKRNIHEAAFEFTLKNAKKTDEVVTVIEPIPGDWEIVNASQPHTKAASNTAVWKIKVPADSSVKLTYKVNTKF